LTVKENRELIEFWRDYHSKKIDELIIKHNDLVAWVESHSLKDLSYLKVSEE